MAITESAPQTTEDTDDDAVVTDGAEVTEVPDAVLEEVLVEEISIDGMCGVY